MDEGAGLKEEEVELAGDGSTEDGESMQSAESREEVELLRLFFRAFIHTWSRHFAAVMRFLKIYGKGHQNKNYTLRVESLSMQQYNINQCFMTIYNLLYSICIKCLQL